MDLQNLKQKALNEKKDSVRFFNYIKKRKPADLDKLVRIADEEVFENTDCLLCANCCKTTSPIFRSTDIERLAKHLRIRPSDFIEKYLKTDEDNDYVLQNSPCPFLGTDNYCSVYESRPIACREYPHTNRKRFYQVVDLALKNAEICPAVFEIIQKLKTNYPY